MRILLIRHGEPDYTTDTLTPTGRREAELLSQEPRAYAPEMERMIRPGADAWPGICGVHDGVGLYLGDVVSDDLKGQVTHSVLSVWYYSSTAF